MDTDPKLNSMDTYIGKRLKSALNHSKYSREEISTITSISAEELEKFEQGMQRIGSDKLSQLAKVLNQPVTYFFQGISAEQNIVSTQFNYTNDAHLTEAMASFNNIKSPCLKQNLLKLVSAVADDQYKQAKALLKLVIH